MQATLEGLTKNDIKNIQKWHMSGKLHFNRLKIQQTIPFAPFMFLGVLLTILLKMNIVLWLK